MPSSRTQQYLLNSMRLRILMTSSVLLSHHTQYKMMYTSRTRVFLFKETALHKKKFLCDEINTIRHIFILKHYGIIPPK